MIGSGIFLLPASLAALGPISLAGWTVTSIGALVLAVIFGRLSRIVTKTGGPYAYTEAGFGEFAGFLIAWGYWITLWTGNAGVAVALARLVPNRLRTRRDPCYNAAIILRRSKLQARLHSITHRRISWR